MLIKLLFPSSSTIHSMGTVPALTQAVTVTNTMDLYIYWFPYRVRPLLLHWLAPRHSLEMLVYSVITSLFGNKSSQLEMVQTTKNPWIWIWILQKFRALQTCSLCMPQPLALKSVDVWPLISLGIGWDFSHSRTANHYHLVFALQKLFRANA